MQLCRNNILPNSIWYKYMIQKWRMFQTIITVNDTVTITINELITVKNTVAWQNIYAFMLLCNMGYSWISFASTTLSGLECGHCSRYRDKYIRIHSLYDSTLLSSSDSFLIFQALCGFEVISISYDNDTNALCWAYWQQFLQKPLLKIWKWTTTKVLVFVNERHGINNENCVVVSSSQGIFFKPSVIQVVFHCYNIFSLVPLSQSVLLHLVGKVRKDVQSTHIQKHPCPRSG